MIYELAILAVLLIASILDLTTKKIPSFFLTTAILASLILHMDNLFFAVSAGIFGLLLWDFNFFKGTADIKALALIGTAISNLDSFLAMMVLIAVFGAIYQGAFKYLKKSKEVAFLPAITIIFAIMIALEVVA